MFGWLLDSGVLPAMRASMRPVKDTVRALVRIGYDGRVHKIFRGHMAKERFENEVRVLKYLEEKEWCFVPKVLETDPEQLLLVTTNCGQRVEHLGEARRLELFAESEGLVFATTTQRCAT